jgi:hypothetical protein
MSARQRLPNRRASVTFPFECDRMAFTATVSFFADGRPAELFISNHKSGSQVDHSARDAAILCSLALQRGATLEAVHGALQRDDQGLPITPVGIALATLMKMEGATTD